ncbi:hypothetical protein [Flavobacterium sp.]|uniref:hypothetical protein n=1 Tax=Flavobacterium sp. TaxID=239 RepID=UPI0038FC4D5F
MKTSNLIVAFSFVLFSINSLHAQFGNNGFGNGMNRQNNGMNQMSQPTPDDKPEEVPVEKTVGIIMERMKTEVNLDELQVIAISIVLKESIIEQGKLLKQKFSQEDQIKNFEALSETTDRKIGEFLNKDQKEKYILFKEEIKNPKKSNSKRKKK